MSKGTAWILIRTTTPVTLCWNTSLNVTIHLPESAALPPLNVEGTNFGHDVSHCYQHCREGEGGGGRAGEVFQQMCSKL